MKTYCEKCGRETAHSAQDRNASRKIINDCCFKATGIIHAYTVDCLSFAAGRRAGLKEAEKIAKSRWQGFPLSQTEMIREIRSALKAPKVSK